MPKHNLKHSRSRIEEKDMPYSVRINGRIAAAFRNNQWAKDFTYQLKTNYPTATVELTDGDINLLRLLPTIMQTGETN